MQNRCISLKPHQQCSVNIRINIQQHTTQCTYHIDVTANRLTACALKRRNSVPVRRQRLQLRQILKVGHRVGPVDDVSVGGDRRVLDACVHTTKYTKCVVTVADFGFYGLLPVL